MDPHKLRPREGWVLVLDDQRKTKVGLIHLTANQTGIEKVTEGSGTIIAVGNGEKNATIGVEKGVKIVYRGFLKEAHKIPNEERWTNEDGTPGDGKIYFLMDSNDILGLVPPGVEVGVFSGRPQVPEGTNEQKTDGQ